MKVIKQTLDELVENLGPLDVEWMDETAVKAIAKLKALPQKKRYDREDIKDILDTDFTEGLLAIRLFLGLSKDSLEAALRRELITGVGPKSFGADPAAFCEALEGLGLLEKMAEAVNYAPSWYDILIERLRSGRGSAISGQRRGRGLEDFTEVIVKEVFGEGGYETRVTFSGTDRKSAKCDIAIPSKASPQIVIESKGYGATGSKMTDIIGDLDAIIDAKRHDTALIFVTDGLTWNARKADLRKIIARQNDGKIMKIYTSKMAAELKEDLETLKREKHIE